MEELKEYQTEYRTFITNYQRGVTGADEVGMLIVNMANHFSDANFEFGEAEIIYNQIASGIEFEVDPDTGKQLPSTKAKIKSEATEEFGMMRMAEIHVQNIEQYLNALKMLQRGIQNDYNHLGTT